MSGRVRQAPDPADALVAGYKRMLRDLIDRRPSGTRLKIARALGKHKSFVSQITNPAYPTPVPARHLGTIFDLCRCSPEEREAVLAAYAAAHPRRALVLEQASAVPPAAGVRSILIELPALGDARREADLAETVRRLAGEAIDLARKWSTVAAPANVPTQEESSDEKAD